MQRILSLSFCWIAVATVLAVAHSNAASPASQPASSIPPSSITTKSPATQPVKAKDPIPKDWVKVENTKYNYTFYVPKKWDKDVVNDTQADYHLPAPKNKEPPLFLFAGGDCHEITLDAQVATVKKALTDQHPKAKLTKDESTTLGGRPAWLMITEESVQHTVPPQTATQKPRMVTQKINSLSIVYVQGKATFTVSFVADSSAFSDNLRTVQHVVDSFAWTDAEKTEGAKP